MALNQVLRIWNNLLKFLFPRWLAHLAESSRTLHRVAVVFLRQVIRKLPLLRFLSGLINRWLPCPRIARRYIQPSLDIANFASMLNERKVRYVILPGLEQLPHSGDGDTTNLLVQDDDIDKIRDLFVALPAGLSCNVYSVSALPGASYLRGISYYPPLIAQEILDSSTTESAVYRVPDSRHSLLALAYSAVYHEAEASGLALSKELLHSDAKSESLYSCALRRLSEAADLMVSPDLQSLHELLSDSGWMPRLDVLRRLAKDSHWLNRLVRDIEIGRRPSRTTLGYWLNIQGVRIYIETDCPAILEYVRRDFDFFHDLNTKMEEPHIRLTFLNKQPPWNEIGPEVLPLFKTVNSRVYKIGPNRYIDHEREVLAIYDMKRDEGTVYSLDPAAMYRVAYSIVMTRLGLRLDLTGYHRAHALGIALDDRALVLLADSGCGKTTLGLEMMKCPKVSWLSDDIVLFNRSGKALGLPASPRIVGGSIVPWLPSSTTLLQSPIPKTPPKVQIPLWSMVSRVRPSAEIACIFLCTRTRGAGPSIEPAGFSDAFKTLCKSGFNGAHLGERFAYRLEFSPSALLTRATVSLSRLKTFLRIAWTTPVYRFAMGELSENAEMLMTHLEGKAPTPSKLCTP
jgi:hypothetical protein